MKIVSLFLFAGCLGCFAASPSIATVSDQAVASVEREVVSLAEAMPGDKYSFAPTNGEFSGVRTFGQQMTHIATVNYEVAAAMLGEKMPVEGGKNENGADSLQSKEAAVKYLKDSFAYTHKAMMSLTSGNYMGMVKSPFGKDETPRAALSSVPVWHSFDHYGQAVVYARMNGVVPPASRH